MLFYFILFLRKKERQNYHNNEDRNKFIDKQTHMVLAKSIRYTPEMLVQVQVVKTVYRGQPNFLLGFGANTYRRFDRDGFPSF